MSSLENSINRLLATAEETRNLVVILIRNDISEISELPSSPDSLSTLSTSPNLFKVFATNDYSDTNISVLLKFLSKTPFHEMEKDLSASVCNIRPAITSMRTLTINWKTLPSLLRHYQVLFRAILQMWCKEIAKLWIKALEPNKQAKHPYKNMNNSKPSWWPNEVDHIEPDHLDKESRVDLLVSLVRNRSLSLEELRKRLLHLHSKHKYLKVLFDELFYVAAYERLFFTLERDKDPLFDALGIETQQALSSPKGIKIVVSDFTSAKIGTRLGVLMLGQMTDKMINKQVFKVNQVVRRKVVSESKREASRKRTRASRKRKISEVDDKSNSSSETEETLVKLEEQSPKYRRISSLSLIKNPGSHGSANTSQEANCSSNISTRPSSAIYPEDCIKAELNSKDKFKEVSNGLQLFHRPGILSNEPVSESDSDTNTPDYEDRDGFQLRTYDSDYSPPNVDPHNYVIAQECLPQQRISPPPTTLEAWNFEHESSPEDTMSNMTTESGLTTAVHTLS